MSNTTNTALLILYNPYYQSDVIEAHLEVLKREGKVYFGKIKSKMRNTQSCKTSLDSETSSDMPLSVKNTESSLDSIKLHAAFSIPKPTQNKPLQLFLTDYANLFVCEVVAIVEDSSSQKGNSTDSKPYDSDNSSLRGRSNPPFFCHSELAKQVKNPKPFSSSLRGHKPEAIHNLEQQSNATPNKARDCHEVLQTSRNDKISESNSPTTSNPHAIILQSSTESTPINPRYCPTYYEQKGLEVELWFEITDMRELVRDDFVRVRDEFLGCFSTPHNNRTFALYGNDYTYPLAITPKKAHNYFATRYIYKRGGLLASKHYHDIFKSQEQQDMREKLIDYTFGALADSMCVDTLDNLINAELEYHANRLNPLYDCTGIVLWLGKSAELEIRELLCVLLEVMIGHNPRIAELSQSVQEKKFKLGEWVSGAVDISINLGSIKHILRDSEVKNAFDLWKNEDSRGKNKGGMSRHDVWQFVRFRLTDFIESIQNVRNRAAHAPHKNGINLRGSNHSQSSKPSLSEVGMLREQMLGIGQPSVLCEILRAKVALQSL